MLGKDGVEHAFGRSVSSAFDIHRTRRGFEDDGIDDFGQMAEVGVLVTDRSVSEMPGGKVDFKSDVWRIPPSSDSITDE